MTFCFPLSNPLDMDIWSVDGSIEHIEFEIKVAFNLLDFLENNTMIQYQKINELKNKKFNLETKRQELIVLMIQKDIEIERKNNCRSV